MVVFHRLNYQRVRWTQLLYWAAFGHFAEWFCVNFFTNRLQRLASCPIAQTSMTVARSGRNWFKWFCGCYFVIPGSSKKRANQLEVWRGELDTPGPPISMLCDSSAWRSLQKKTDSCSGHWEAMVSNIETGGRGASGGCWNFLVDGCFFWRTRYLVTPRVIDLGKL